MKSTWLSSAFVGAAFFLSHTCYSAPQGFHNARAISMGGTGVATSFSASAPLFNPALLSKQHKKGAAEYGFIAPSISLSVAFDDKVVDDIEDFQDNNVWQNLLDAITIFNSVTPTTDPAFVEAALNNVIDKATVADKELSDLDNESLRSNIGAAMSFAKPQPRFGYALFATIDIEASGVARYNDSETINSLIDTASDLLNDPNNANVDLELLPDNPESDGEVIALAITEVGFSIAHTVKLGRNEFQIGASPKLQMVSTFDYLANVDSFEEEQFDAGEQEATEATFNLDVGMAKSFGENNAFTTGLVIKNLFPKDFETARGRNIEINPLAQFGIAHSGAKHTVTAEVDLTETESIGFEGGKQFFSVGGEFRPNHWFSLRGGLAHNFTSNEPVAESIEAKTIFTCGVGFKAGGTHFDFAAIYSENEAGGSAELAFIY